MQHNKCMILKIIGVNLLSYKSEYDKNKLQLQQVLKILRTLSSRLVEFAVSFCTMANKVHYIEIVLHSSKYF